MFWPRQNIPEDADLLRRARGKDRHAIRLIIQRHNQRLFRVARSFLRNDTDAEDALQEAYCNAFANLETFRGESQFGTWLARIVVNEALGCMRRRRPTMELTTMEDTPCFAA
jgi:RNA polymerase sigma-70 factor, ECF subfamily